MRNIKSLKLIIAAGIILLLFSCKEKKSAAEAGGIPTFNIEKTLEQHARNSYKGNAAAEAVIPLETSDKALLGEIRKIIKSGDLFFILDTNGNLKKFNTQGKFQCSIGKAGQGPREYGSMLTDFTVNHRDKEIYINAVEKLTVYDFDGNYKREVHFKEAGKYQVAALCNNKLFYIAPDKQYSDDVKSAALVSVLDLNGKLEKELSAKELRREKGFVMFNNIAADGKSVFYKEEFGRAVYAVGSDYAADSLCLLDFGKYALRSDELEMSKQKVWKERCRLQNILPAEDYIVFIIQKGLIDPEFIPFIWIKKNNLFCSFDYKAVYNGGKYPVLPFAVSDNKIVGVLASDEEDLDADNPVLVVLRLK